MQILQLAKLKNLFLDDACYNKFLATLCDHIDPFEIALLLDESEVICVAVKTELVASALKRKLTG